MTLLKIKIAKFEFSPGIVASVITLVLIITFVYLGYWQLGRMTQKKNILKMMQSRTAEEVLEFSNDEAEVIDRDVDSFRFYRIQMKGEFLKDQDILLDNQIYKGRPGYRVLSPFLNDASNALVLVDRGWVSWGDDRNELPEIIPVHGKKVFIGIINKIPSMLALAHVDSPTDFWPLRVQSINPAALQQTYKKPIHQFIVQLQEDSPYGYTVTPLYFGLTADRHLGYAAQWFTMAVAVFMYYVVVNLRRRE